MAAAGAMRNPPRSIPIDPALDVPGPSRAQSTSAQSRPSGGVLTEKVAGARRKGKVAVGVASIRRGTPAGSVNFSPEDVELLLMMVEEHLPLGQLGWQKVVKDYNEYAVGEGRPQRAVDSLKHKFTQVSAYMHIFLNYTDRAFSLQGRRSPQGMAIARRKSSTPATSTIRLRLVLLSRISVTRNS